MGGGEGCVYKKVCNMCVCVWDLLGRGEGYEGTFDVKELSEDWNVREKHLFQNLSV